MLWRVWKLFPHAYAGGLSDDDLTEDQWLWFQCQLLLDDGIEACETCETLAVGPYCHTCGARMQPEPRTCDQCHMLGTGAYCSHCGAPLESAVAVAIEEQRFDWDAWARSLTPFLGGLTPQEETLLAADAGRTP